MFSSSSSNSSLSREEMHLELFRITPSNGQQHYLLVSLDGCSTSQKIIRFCLSDVSNAWTTTMTQEDVVNFPDEFSSVDKLYHKSCEIMRSEKVSEGNYVYVFQLVVDDSPDERSLIFIKNEVNEITKIPTELESVSLLLHQASNPSMITAEIFDFSISQVSALRQQRSLSQSNDVSTIIEPSQIEDEAVDVKDVIMLNYDLTPSSVTTVDPTPPPISINLTTTTSSTTSTNTNTSSVVEPVDSLSSADTVESLQAVVGEKEAEINKLRQQLEEVKSPMKTRSSVRKTKITNAKQKSLLRVKIKSKQMGKKTKNAAINHVDDEDEFSDKFVIVEDDPVVTPAVSVSQETSYVCVDCGREYKMERYLIVHRYITHNDTSQSPSVKKRVKYSCKECGNMYANLSSLKTHMLLHNPPSEDLTCQYCQRQFTRADSYRYHMMAHMNDRPFPCPKCDKAFTQRTVLRKHMNMCNSEKENDPSKTDGWMRVQPVPEAGSFGVNKGYGKLKNVKTRIRKQKPSLTGGNILICQHCHQTFDHIRHLKIHITMRHGEDKHRIIRNTAKYKCHLCTRSFKSKHIFEFHKKRHLQLAEPLFCKFCSKSFKRKDGLKYHEMAHENKRPFKCHFDDCHKEFTHKGVLQKHVKFIHNGGEKEVSVECKSCGKKYDTYHGLKMHTRLHKHAGEYGCTDCDKVFDFKIYLQKHILIKHTPDSDKKFDCPVCLKKFVTKTILKAHMVSHTDARPYLCPVCSKGFKKEGDIRIHMRSHTGDRPYLCWWCGKGFTVSSALKVHIRSQHTKERPFSCDVCKKSFTESGKLKMHMAVHSEQRPYECDSCGKAFKRRSHLKRHYKLHPRLNNLPVSMIAAASAKTNSTQTEQQQHAADVSKTDDDHHYTSSSSSSQQHHTTHHTSIIPNNNTVETVPNLQTLPTINRDDLSHQSLFHLPPIDANNVVDRSDLIEVADVLQMGSADVNNFNVESTNSADTTTNTTSTTTSASSNSNNNHNIPVGSFVPLPRNDSVFNYYTN